MKSQTELKEFRKKYVKPKLKKVRLEAERQILATKHWDPPGCTPFYYY